MTTTTVWRDDVELVAGRTCLLEASAGTGKTYQIANLVVRLVAAYDVKISAILAITFTNAATAELSDRVRARLAEARDALVGAEAPPERDQVLSALWNAGEIERRRFGARLEAALRSFDSAGISTIHGFANRILQELAFESGEDTGLEMLQDATDVLERVVDDTLGLFWRSLTPEAARLATESKIDRKTFLDVATKMTDATTPRIVPPIEGELSTDVRAIVQRMASDPARAAAIFAATVRPRVEAELRRRRALTFSSILSRVAEQMEAGGGPTSSIATQLRARYHAVLVDEFQDTDRAQWSVIRDAFHGQEGVRLFLIGDPKQAIYAFRGADVHVYLAAKDVVKDGHATMTTNWRSDPAVIRALNALFVPESGCFDQAGIDYVEVHASAESDRLSPAGPGLVVRWLDETEGVRVNNKGRGQSYAANAAANAIKALLESGAEIEGEDGKRPIGPGDIAVLVGAHHEGASMRAALRKRGIPSVAASKATVLQSQAAQWVRDWLEAVAGAGRDRAAKRAVTNPMFGWTAEELAWALTVAEGTTSFRDAPERVQQRDWIGWTESLRQALQQWSVDGFARVFDRALEQHDVLANLLGLPRGERHATDLRHVFEILHREEREKRIGPGLLASFLRHAEDDDSEADELAQRLESDAKAVRIETIHRSKGLEYPVVFVPFAWNQSGPKSTVPLAYRDADGPVLHFNPKNDPSAKKAAEDELKREAYRKLYVALTRAKHRCFVWYGPIGTAGESTGATALGTLLMRQRGTTGVVDPTMPIFSEARGVDAWKESEKRLGALAEASDEAIVWSRENARSSSSARWQPRKREAESATPAPAPWREERSKTLNGIYAVTSFSAMHEAVAVHDGDEPIREAEGGIVGEARRHASADPDDHEEPATAQHVEGDVASYGARLSKSGGTAYGTWVHHVFEHVDFQTSAPRDGTQIDELVTRLGKPLGAWDAEAAATEIVACLPRILATPLDTKGGDIRGAMVEVPEGFSLASLKLSDRVDEFAFDLRVGAGSRHPAMKCPDGQALERGGAIDPAAIYAAVVSRDEAPDFVGKGWVDAQKKRLEAKKRLIDGMTGILTGSIDLVFRVKAEVPGGYVYYLVDYKTNRIKDSTPMHYTSQWMDWEMARKGYPLQSLLYSVALHRHLKSRLGDHYDYEEHIGGYFYLFARGMGGGALRDQRTGRALGVLGDRWPKSVVEALDRALDARPTALTEEVVR